MTDRMLDAAQDSKEMNRNILTLAWPVVSRLFLQSVVGVVDIMMVGRLGAAAIASVSVSNRIMFILIGALQALAVGSSTLVAQHTGAGNHDSAKKVVWQALYGSFLLALILSSIGFWQTPNIIRGMLSLMETIDLEVLNYATVYLRIVFLAMIFMLPQICINALLQGMGDMKTPLIVMTISNLFNVVGNYVLIFGVGPFPELGVTGAAIATGGSRVLAALLSLGFLIRGTKNIRLELSQISWRLNTGILKKVLDIGVPAAVEQLVRHSSMVIYAFLVAGLGTAAMAANEIAMSIQSMSSMPGFGFGLAATTLVGQSLGAKKFKLAARYGAQTMKLAAFLLASLGFIMLLSTRFLIGLYTSDPEVISAAVVPLRIVALIQPLFAVVMVLSGALRGAGDTKWVMYATMIGNWGLRVGLATFLAFYFNAGLPGLWLALSLDIAIRSLLIVARYRTGKWQVNLVEGRGRARVKQASA